MDLMGNNDELHERQFSLLTATSDLLDVFYIKSTFSFVDLYALLIQATCLYPFFWNQPILDDTSNERPLPRPDNCHRSAIVTHKSAWEFS